MTGLDTNVLVAVAVRSHPHHQRALAAVAAAFSAHGGPLVISPVVVAEFLHAVTDPRRVQPALTMTEAQAWLGTWNQTVGLQWCHPDAATSELWLRWLKEFHLGRKRILDTLLAATLHPGFLTEKSRIRQDRPVPSAFSWSSCPGANRPSVELHGNSRAWC